MAANDGALFETVVFLEYFADLVEGKSGDRLIKPEEAVVVERIFRDFAAGHSPRRIGRKLSDVASYPGKASGCDKPAGIRNGRD